MDQVEGQVKEALRFLCQAGGLKPNQLVVLGCSTSEIQGGNIGKSGSEEVGEAVMRGALSVCGEYQLHLAVQCCEHLNRALVVTKELAESRGYPRVIAEPHPKAGGACAYAAFRMMREPVLVEEVCADAGMDIGLTLIGMHLRRVAVPLRASVAKIGEAQLVMAYTRPKYIGGPRTHYPLA